MKSTRNPRLAPVNTLAFALPVIVVAQICRLVLARELRQPDAASQLYALLYAAKHWHEDEVEW